MTRPPPHRPAAGWPPLALLLAALLAVGLTLPPNPARAAADTGQGTGQGAELDTTGLHDRPVLVVDPGQHTAPINRASMDAKGAFVVTASHDKTLRIWSVADGALQNTIRVPAGPGNTGKLYAVALSPDGAVIAAGGFTAADGQLENIHLFDRASGLVIGRISGLPGSVYHLAFSPDGRRLLATLAGSNGVRLYDRDRGWAELARDSAYGGASYGAAFSPDGRLATSSYDGIVRLYDAALTPLARWASGTGQRPFDVAFSPDGRRLAVGFAASTRVVVLDGRNLTQPTEPDRRGLDNGTLSKVAWSADDRLLAGGTYDQDGGSPVVVWADGGRGPRRTVAAGHNTVMSLLPLGGRGGGGWLVASQDPALTRIGADGAALWTRGPTKADFRGQRRTLALSADGLRVDFGYQPSGMAPARFDLSTLTLSPAPPADGSTAPPRQSGLPITDWEDNDTPKRAGTPLPLDQFERSRSLAVQADGARFLLGTDWSLRAFAADGTPLWTRPVPGVVWAVAISGDGRLAVAAYDDGTIRWHRMEDGRELLAFMPLVNPAETVQQDWVAWTPEGFYDATPGANRVLRWHINHGWNAATTRPVSDIPGARRPDLLLQALRDPDAISAQARNAIVAVQQAVAQATGINPGARLHTLTIGIARYGDKAKHLNLQHADADARDVSSRLNGGRGRRYVKGTPQVLDNENATKHGIFRAFQTLRSAMTSDRDIAVLLYSGHGKMVDGEYYLFPHDVDARDSVGILNTGLSLTDLKRQIGLVAAQGRVLLLLDACYSGTAANGEQIDAQRLSSLLKTPQVSVLTSSAASEVSRERTDWGHGAFSKALLEALDPDATVNRNREISVLTVAKYVRKRVQDLSGQTVAMDLNFDEDLFDPSLP